MANSPSERARNAAFARRLQALMDERELSQSDVATLIWGRRTSSEGKNVAKGRDRLCNWLKGKNFPDRENLEKLATALGVRTTDLVPDADLKAASQMTPQTTVAYYEDGTAWLQINKIVPARIAAEIMTQLADL